VQVLVLDEAMAAADLVQGPPFKKEFGHSFAPYVLQVLVLDEATATVDLVQVTIRKEFVHCLYHIYVQVLVLVLDEARAAADLVQAAIKKEFVYNYAPYV
jgi:RecB family exonuclease